VTIVAAQRFLDPPVIGLEAIEVFRRHSLELFQQPETLKPTAAIDDDGRCRLKLANLVKNSLAFVVAVTVFPRVTVNVDMQRYHAVDMAFFAFVSRSPFTLLT